jgi:hypothetical protein
MKQKGLHIFRLISIVIAIVMIMGMTHPLSATAKVSGMGIAAEELQAAQPEIDKANARQKVDPLLFEIAESGTSEQTTIMVTAMAGLDFSAYGKVVAKTRPDPMGYIGYLMQVPANRIMKVADLAQVYMVSSTGEKPAPEVMKPDKPDQPQVAGKPLETSKIEVYKSGHANAVTLTAEKLAVDPITPDSWFENGTQGVEDTWALGVTGEGDPVNPVKIAVLDSGVDFCNPALYNRWAVQDAALTPAYNGWPIAYDDRSAQDFLINYPNPGTSSAIPETNNYGWYVRTEPFSGSEFTDPLYGYVYTIPAEMVSVSGTYRWGYNPDALWHDLAVQVGAPTVFMATDSTTAGVYDQVWFDSDWDGIFDSFIDKSNPGGCVDWTSPTSQPDGVADDSLGLLYWVSDGVNPLPGVSAIYSNTPIPEAGEILMFMVGNIYEAGGDHGTLCASSAAGYDGGLLVDAYGQLAAWYDGISIVSAPGSGGAMDSGADVIAMGDFYAGGSNVSNYLFTTVGYDSEFSNGDEPQITSMSFGSGGVDDDAWDAQSQYLSALNLTLEYFDYSSPMFVKSSGNGGAGYGTVNTPGSVTGLTVGASTQYGTDVGWGVWEGVSSADRVAYQDIQPWSDRGPGAMSNLTPHVVANGAWGSGASITSYSTYYEGTDGSAAWYIWGGTSRSTPVVAGMMALIYDAYFQGNGVYPDWREARKLIMNSAKDIGYDEFVGGAGAANPYFGSLAALGDYGFTVDPPYYTAGGFEGTKYEAFATGLNPGETDTTTFTVDNPSNLPITVGIRDEQLQLTDSEYFTLVTNEQGITTSNYGLGAPDYAVDLTSMIAANPDADLMIVRVNYPFEFFDNTAMPPTPATYANRYIGLIYNVYDDGDGKWWTDKDGDGRVDVADPPTGSAELDVQDEYTRMTYSYLRNTQQELRVHHPNDRKGSGGIWLGLTHNVTTGADTTLGIEVLFYKELDWADISLSTTSLVIPAGGSATFDATITAGLTDAPGSYTGRIVVSDLTAVNGHEVVIPLLKNVYGTVDITKDPVVLGGTPRANTPYDNGFMYGQFSWGGRGEEADWRAYQVVVKENAPAGASLLVDSKWEDYPTDIDTLILDPVQHWAFGGFPFNDPMWFGPYTQDYRGDGSLRYGARPNWGYYTNVDGTTGTTAHEILSASAEPGLHTILQAAVLYGGEQPAVGFETTVGTGAFTPNPLIINLLSAAPTAPMSFNANISLPNGFILGGAYGWFKPTTSTVEVYQDNPDDPYDAPSVAQPITLSGTYRLDVATSNPWDAADIDLYVVRDADSDGILETTDPIVASSAGSTAVESITIRQPADGQYFIVIQGWSVSGAPGYLDLYIKNVAGANAMTATGLPTVYNAFDLSQFAIDVLIPPSTITETWEGLLLFGPPEAPTAFEVPVYTDGGSPLYLPMILK